MDKAELRTVSRPGSEQADKSAGPPKKSSLVSWRTISFLGPPLVLGLINLVEANFERQKAVISGDQNYARLVGEGEQAKRIATEEGATVGQNRKRGILNEAKGHADEIIAAASDRGHLLSQQGDLADPLLKQQAEATMGMMRPLHEITENLLQITRFALLNHERIEISLGSELLSDVKYVGRRGITVAEKSESERRVSDYAPRLTRNAMNARYRLDASSRRSAVCE